MPVYHAAKRDNSAHADMLVRTEWYFWASRQEALEETVMSLITAALFTLWSQGISFKWRWSGQEVLRGVVINGVPDFAFRLPILSFFSIMVPPCCSQSHTANFLTLRFPHGRSSHLMNIYLCIIMIIAIRERFFPPGFQGMSEQKPLEHSVWLNVK